MDKYRYDIGLGDKYLFGTELEFTGVYLDNLSKLFRSTSLPVKLAINHKSTGYIMYDEWYLDVDSTVTKRIDGRLYGGELSSRILTDKTNAWMELKDICDVLKSTGASISDRCSNHVRVNLSSIKDEKYFFEVLSKLITLYEKEIRLFYMGDDYLVRSTGFDYARNLSPSLIDYIGDINHNDEDYMYKFRTHRGITYFSRNDAINLQDYNEKKLMEVRYANGSINPKTIQNNINFTLKLVDAIRREVFDLMELTRNIRDKKYDLFIQSMLGESQLKDFEYLVRNIATSEEDVDDFMSQYEHVLSKKPKFN